MKIILLTSLDVLVREAVIEEQDSMPTVVTWGDRVFTYGYTRDGVTRYREVSSRVLED